MSDTPMLFDEVMFKLTKDMKEAVKRLSPREVRYLVDTYYQMQESRKVEKNQERALTESNEPCEVIASLGDVHKKLEVRIKSMLKSYAEGHPVGQWMMDQIGIGPVIAAGLLAHIDIEKAPSVSHIYTYGGIAPNQKWEKGQKRPWNAALKRLFWIMGDCFLKTSGHKDSVYGKLVQQRLEYERAKNAAGDYADQAAEGLGRVGKTTEAYKAYKENRLPAGRILLRAQRHAVKIFLSHMHRIWFAWKYGKDAPRPWALEFGGHCDYISAPGLEEEVAKYVKKGPRNGR